MFELDRYSVSFGPGTALRAASLTIRPGDRLGVVGESGSGKTMLGLSLMGMVPDAATQSGTLRVDGKDMTGAPDIAWRALRARRVAMIFQEPMAALNPLRRVGETVAEPLRVHLGLGAQAARQRALALFEEVGLPDAAARLRQFPHELSGGQRQRVLIALALACDPTLLIADEPTTALDPNVALRIIDLLVRLALPVLRLAAVSFRPKRAGPKEKARFVEAGLLEFPGLTDRWSRARHGGAVRRPGGSHGILRIVPAGGHGCSVRDPPVREVPDGNLPRLLAWARKGVPCPDRGSD